MENKLLSGDSLSKSPIKDFSKIESALKSSDLKKSLPDAPSQPVET